MAGTKIGDATLRSTLKGTENIPITDSDLPVGRTKASDLKKYVAPDLKEYAKLSDIPNIDGLLSETEADNKYQPKGSYLTEIPEEYVTETGLEAKGYETKENASTTYATKEELSNKQDALVSGTNIKTVNGQSILGAGNIEISGGGEGGGIADAPSDGNLYGRKNANWEQIIIPDTSTLATKEELASKANASDLSNYLTTANAESTYATKTDLEGKLDTSTYTSDKSSFALKTEIPDTSNLATKEEVGAKQDALVSGTNIKTVNGHSILGEGNIQIETPEGGISDAPQDSKTYGRNNGAWVEVTSPDLSSYATQSFVESKVAEVVNSAPETLDTLNELASALGNDANFATTMATQLGNKLDTSTYNSDKATFALKTELTTKLDVETYNTDKSTFETTEHAAATYQPKGDYANTSSLNSKLDTSTYNADKATFALKTELPDISTKQDTLVSGTNIKTINGESLLGSGDIAITGGSDIDLSDYVTKSSLSETLIGYVDSNTYVADKATFALKTELSSYLTTSAAESTYAKKTDIPDVSTYLTKTVADGYYQPKGSYLTAVPDEYVTETELTEKGYATTTQLGSKLDTSTYNSDKAGFETTEHATATYQPKGNYALKSEIPNTSGFATKTELQSVKDITDRYIYDEVTSLATIPSTHAYLRATLSSNQSLSLDTPTDWPNCSEVYIFAKNTASSDITVTIPNSNGYINMSAETLTIPAGKGAEISIFKTNNQVWIRHAVSEMEIDISTNLPL